VEDLEVPAKVLVERQHRRHVTAAVAVVGGAPNRRDALAGEMVLEPLHDELIWPTRDGDGGKNNIKRDVWKESKKNTARGRTDHVRVWC